jgi:hypothetical protein
MGNNMGISSMAITSLNINEMSIKKVLNNVKDLPSNPALPFKITKDDYIHLINQIECFEDCDIEIFMALFELFDNRGDNIVLYRELIVGVCGCLVVASLKEKLLLSFELYDIKGNNNLNRADLRKILIAINDTASFFGDHVLELNIIEDIVSDAFTTISILNSSEESTVNLSDIDFHQCADYLIEDKSIITFVDGKGSKTFGH